MHPRKALRADIAEIITGAGLDVDVHTSHARALAPSETCVLVYVTSEATNRPQGAGEGRSGRPYRRQMSVAIIVTGPGAGTGAATLDALDDIARGIELAVNNATADLVLDGTETRFVEDGKSTRAEITMTYTAEITDKMER